MKCLIIGISFALTFCVSLPSPLPTSPTDRRIPQRVLLHGRSAYRSDTVQAHVADPSESLRVFHRNLHYDIPQQESFGSEVNMESFENKDDQISFYTQEQKTRADDHENGSVSNYERDTRYIDQQANEGFYDTEEGNHATHTDGDRTGIYFRESAAQTGRNQPVRIFRKDINYWLPAEQETTPTSERFELPNRQLFLSYGNPGQNINKQRHDQSPRVRGPRDEDPETGNIRTIYIPLSFVSRNSDDVAATDDGTTYFDGSEFFTIVGIPRPHEALQQARLHGQLQPDQSVGESNFYATLGSVGDTITTQNSWQLNSQDNARNRQEGYPVSSNDEQMTSADVHTGISTETDLNNYYTVDDTPIAQYSQQRGMEHITTSNDGQTYSAYPSAGTAKFEVVQGAQPSTHVKTFAPLAIGLPQRNIVLTEYPQPPDVQPARTEDTYNSNSKEWALRQINIDDANDGFVASSVVRNGDGSVEYRPVPSYVGTATYPSQQQIDDTAVQTPRLFLRTPSEESDTPIEESATPLTSASVEDRGSTYSERQREFTEQTPQHRSDLGTSRLISSDDWAGTRYEPSHKPPSAEFDSSLYRTHRQTGVLPYGYYISRVEYDGHLDKQGSFYPLEGGAAPPPAPVFQFQGSREGVYVRAPAPARQ
ncbi:PREDICTED: uncharacterized protein LOC106807356 [Priapulus caudatus]|uniref:Uncharacterized protein LOC106807356 n=1 Tax=Priapulus caudatus TaxID=37621 RepID=A0ABM1DYY2_PRICU|nr:PREDICTED: uncharacterized protein LOC106807356 [Priapulus caudatus]